MVGSKRRWIGAVFGMGLVVSPALLPAQDTLSVDTTWVQKTVVVDVPEITITLVDTVRLPPVVVPPASGIALLSVDDTVALFGAVWADTLPGYLLRAHDILDCCNTNNALATVQPAHSGDTLVVPLEDVPMDVRVVVATVPFGAGGMVIADTFAVPAASGGVVVPPDTTPPPPPPTGGLSFPIIHQSFGGVNEPPGMTPVSLRDWESIGTPTGTPNDWAAQGWWARNRGTYTIQPDRGENVAQAVHRQGMNGGTSGGFMQNFYVANIVGADPTGYSEVYVRFFLKLDPHYRPHGSGVLKTVSPLHSGNGGDHGSGWIRVFGIPPRDCIDPAFPNRIPCDPTWGQTPMRLDFSLHPGWNTGGVQSAVRILTPNRGNASINRGQWYEVEMYLKANSRGGDYHGNGDPATVCSTDGILRIWLDGALKLDYTDVCLHTGKIGSNLHSFPLKHDGIRIWTGYGGVGGPGLPESQFIRFDDFYFAGK